jgi:hypothetical protein
VERCFLDINKQIPNWRILPVRDFLISHQLIITNLPESIIVEHYVKPPIQNILNGLEESFIALNSGDKITFLADNLAKLTIRLY